MGKMSKDIRRLMCYYTAESSSTSASKLQSSARTFGVFPNLDNSFFDFFTRQNPLLAVESQAMGFNYLADSTISIAENTAKNQEE